MTIKNFRLSLGSLLIIANVSAIEGCKEMTPQEENAIVKASGTILCALEGEMLDDPALNKACEEILPRLTPEQRTAVQAHLTAARKAHAAKSSADAGSGEGGK